MPDDDSLRDETFGIEWANDLKHRPRPNDVRDLQTPSPGRFEPRPAVAHVPADPATATPSIKQGSAAARAANPDRARDVEPSYYDISPLKRPLWKYEIAIYFFLGGMSAGAHLLGRAANRFGGESMRDLSRAASFLSLASISASPPLLVHDLGDPKRFHHMLRIWKPSNPMNLGTWAITSYSGAATMEAVRHYLQLDGKRLGLAEENRLRQLMKNGTLLLVQDAVGVPSALLVASYTGVLLSATSNPLWCKNPWLSPLFTASAISTGAEAIMLALDATSRGTTNRRAHKVLRTVDTLGHLIELGCMVGFHRFAGEKAKTLTHGQMRNIHRTSMAGIVGSEVVKAISVPARYEKASRVVANVLGLVGGFAMRWAMVYGGHEAADDPRTARMVSRDRTGSPSTADDGR